MLIAPLFLAAETFFGPVTVTLPLPVEGNPFDPVQNDVRLRLQAGGKTVERVAYYAKGKWHATVSLPEKGAFRGEVWRNGKRVASIPEPVKLETPSPGFVRVSGVEFTLNGKPFWPVGHNLGWQAQNDPDLTAMIARMAKAGCNWARIWTSSWDGKNPFFAPEGKTLKLGWFNESALDRWDQLVKACERSGLRFQFVFFYHGQFSTTVNPNWDIHPFNAKNGGFLKDPKQFFTDPEAKRLAKMLFRYAIARWGHSPAIMAWELFNEVQFTDLARSGDWDAIGAWHDEMADYIRSVDPYRHLVTTSSELHAPIWRKMDYLQGHGYPASLPGMILAEGAPLGKPMFFGEVGLGTSRPTAEEDRQAIRDGIWSAYLAGQSGAGQFWFWDRMGKPGMIEEYEHATSILAKLPNPTSFKTQTLQIDGPRGGDLIVMPGRGWASTTKMEFQIPNEGDARSLGQLSSFLQGQGHRDMQPRPVKFTFQATAPGVFRLQITQVSQSGAHLLVRQNGKVRFDKAWPPAQQNQNMTVDVEVPFEAGPQEIVVENSGPDWVVVSRYEFTGMAPAVSGVAARSDDRFAVRLQGKVGSPVTLTMNGLGSRSWKAATYDLGTGRSTTAQVQTKSNRLSIRLAHGDQLIFLTR